jgi:hypothetical protein
MESLVAMVVGGGVEVAGVDRIGVEIANAFGAGLIGDRVEGDIDDGVGGDGAFVAGVDF